MQMQRFRSRLHSEYINEDYPGELFKNVSIIRRLQPHLWMNQTMEGKLFDVLRRNGDLFVLPHSNPSSFHYFT